jgi:hypothetical protein
MLARETARVLDERWVGALHVVLPPSIDLADPGLAASTHAAVEAVERAK